MKKRQSLLDFLQYRQNRKGDINNDGTNFKN